MVLLALEGEPERDVLEAHREELGDLAAQEVFADAAIRHPAAAGVARIPAAGREIEARVEQQQHGGEQDHGHHELHEGESALVTLHAGFAPDKSVARSTARSRESAPRHATCTSIR